MVKVCVMFGGLSSEHEVSLRSAASVLRNIDKDKYEVHMLGITKDGRWLYYTGDIDSIEAGTWMKQGDKVCPALISPDRSRRGIILMRGGVVAVDVAFPVLHGKNGEDGTVQGLLELAGIPCVGCGVLASAVCMDKEVSHRLLVAAGVPKTKMVCLKKEDSGGLTEAARRLEDELGYPMFVKPANAGSSVGVTKVTVRGGLQGALDAAFAHDRKVVVEQAVDGHEIECSVMGNEQPIAAEVLGEIVPASGGFYDYSAKYLDDTAGLIIPADMDGEVTQRLRELAVKAYRATECRGFARVDFFVKADGAVILNEINTIPGFTSISMFPKLFEASGVEYSEVIDRLIGYAMK